MTNKLPIIALGVGGVVGIVYVVNLLRKGKAGGMVETNFLGFKMIEKNIKGLNSWVKYQAELEIINPSDEKLVFTQPYMKLFIKNKQIASSEVSTQTHTLNPKSKIPLNIDLKVTAQGIAFAIPNFIKFIIAKIKGEPPSQEIRAVYTYTSEGFTQEVTKKVLI